MSRRGVAIACGLLALSPLARAARLDVVVANAGGAPLAGAVVVVEPLGAQPALAAPPAAIDQVDRMFVPHVSVLPVGTAVSFPNHDRIRHQVYSFSAAKRFTLDLYSGTPSRPVVFDRPGVVALGCNIHDSMIGWVLVVATPWTATTDARGLASLEGLPAGRYRVRAWAEPLPDFAGGQSIELGETGRVGITLDPQAYAGGDPADIRD